MLLLAATFLYQARAALLPFFVGAILAYILLPLTNWLDARMRLIVHGRRITRSLAVLIAYGLSILIIVGLLTFAIPLIVTQFNVLGQALPDLARLACALVSGQTTSEPLGELAGGLRLLLWFVIGAW